MRQVDFDELVESIKQAGKIRRGETRASRRFEFRPFEERVRGKTRSGGAET